MAEATGIWKGIRGKVGPLTFITRKNGGTTVFLSPEVKKTPVRSKLQLLIRLVWANLGALFSMFNKTLKHSHEDLRPGLSDYNEFISDNCKMIQVYLDKTTKQQGGCVLAPVLISRGKLPSIYYGANEGGVLVTDISLGEYVIDANTTVAEFSSVVLTNNEDYENGSQLTFFYGQQTVDAVTEVPRAKIKGFKVKLDVTDTETKLWELVSSLGFTSVQGSGSESGMRFLGMDRVITDGAAAWIHTYEDETGKLKVSTQRLVVDSSVLASYMGDAAFEACVQSYGGITNTKKAYLRPDEETNLVGVLFTGGTTGGSDNGSGGSQSGGSDNGSDNGGSQNGGGTTGGEQNTGGEQTGGGAETVEMPVINGTTPFTENTSVTISGPADASIYYTTDGSTPTSESTAYSEAFSLTETATVKAVAVKNGVSSSVAEKVFTKSTGGSGGFETGS